MQRPTRLLVFGVICLIVGGLTGLKNTVEAGLSVAGPDGVERLVAFTEGMGQPLTKSQREDFDVHIRSLRKPVYRVGQGIESVGSAVMSLVLIAAGLGLLLNRAWSLKLTRWWAFYAIPAGAVSVVLSVRYQMPEIPEATAAGGIVGGLFMLVIVWALPVLLLTQLPIEPVRQFLAGRQSRRAQVATMPRPQPVPRSVPPVTQRDAKPVSPATPMSPSTPTADTTWRDDPWNDASSR